MALSLDTLDMFYIVFDFIIFYLTYTLKFYIQ